jgi:argininosuccinate lyase
LPIANYRHHIVLFGCLDAREARIMPQKRLPEASDELRGRTGDVVEVASKPGTPSAKDTISTLVYELSQRLTAIVNSLGATRRLFATGNQVDLRTAQQVVDEAAEQAHLATEVIRQFRKVSFRHAGDVRTKATTIRESQSGKLER